jgi:DNA invertase Pin-like site-specific DNA recombinase
MATIHKCGLYTRVSTEEQVRVEEGSLKNQMLRLKRYVKAKNDMSNDDEWIVAVEYVEEGRSAKNTNRPKYQQMLRDIEDGTIDTVLFSEISRLSRSVFDFLSFGVFLKQHKASFICIANDQINTATPMGNILFVLITALMEFEREINVERSKNAYEEKAKRGLWTGGHLLGYDLDPVHKGHLIVNPSEKKSVGFIFKRYIETGSAYQVAADCRSRNITSKSFKSRLGVVHAGRPMTYTSVKQILRNSTFIGLKEIHKKEKGRTKDDYGKPLESRFETIKTDCWEPIIDETLFYDVQRKLDESEKTHTKAGNADANGFLLSQVLFCECCRETLTNGGTSKNGRTIRHYVHRLRGKRSNPSHKGVCELPPNINADLLDKVTWARVSRDLDADALLREALETPVFDSGERVRHIRDEIAECERVIEENRQCRENALLAFESRTIDPPMQRFLDQQSADNAGLTRQIADYEEQLASLTRAKPPSSKGGKTAPKSLDALDVDRKRQLLKMTVRQVVLVKNGIVIERYQGETIVGCRRRCESAFCRR